MTSASTAQTLAPTAVGAGPDRLRNATNAGPGLPEEGDPETPTEAAEQFEEVLVRQFVEVMTKDMFSNTLAGKDGGGGWMKSQRSRQRDMMTDMITDHLVESGNLQISKKLTERWGVSDAPASTEAPSSEDASPLKRPVDPLPITPSDPARSPTDTPSTHEGRHVDHAV